MTSGSVRTGLVLMAALAGLTGCKPTNKFVAPPPPEVGVAVPLQQTFTPFIVETGNTQAFNSVDLVARVEGFLVKINYQDGAAVKKGDLLFEIDPTTYIAKVKQAEAELAGAKAQLVNAQADFDRQAQLLKTSVTAQTTYDQAKAKRDSASANVDNQEANLIIAKTNLDYTKVMAPFDGVVTKHLVSVGELVGNGVATKLAQIVQLDPIYVSFSISEQDALKIRAGLTDHRLTREEMNKVEIDIGLMTEEGYPHKGKLDYTAPELDTTTGTFSLRGLFENPRSALLPGLYTRVRVPVAFQQKTSLVIPNRSIAEDQIGKYVLVVGKDDVVEQRRITAGQLLTGNFRVIDQGLTATDRVVISTNGLAVPGNKVAPKLVTLQAPAATPASATQAPATQAPTTPAPATPAPSK